MPDVMLKYRKGPTLSVFRYARYVPRIEANCLEVMETGLPFVRVWP